MPICHRMVRETAQKIAMVTYDQLCQSDNTFYKLNPSAKHFCNLWWPRLVPKARATLATMLSGNYDERLKAQIHNALILDHQIRGMGGK